MLIYVIINIVKQQFSYFSRLTSHRLFGGTWQWSSRTTPYVIWLQKSFEMFLFSVLLAKHMPNSIAEVYFVMGVVCVGFVAPPSSSLEPWLDKCVGHVFVLPISVSWQDKQFTQLQFKLLFFSYLTIYTPPSRTYSFVSSIESSLCLPWTMSYNSFKRLFVSSWMLLNRSDVVHFV